MKSFRTYLKRIKSAVPATAAALLCLLTTNSCERRELWVYQDQFKQLLLLIDWRDYDRDIAKYPHTPDPDGMTLWFFPTDGRKSYQVTTSEVNRYETYLSEGDYEGLVIDYSPAEYGHQQFVGMDYANTAEVKSIVSPYQPTQYPELYGTEAYGKTMAGRVDSTGFYRVVYEPERMASDTIFFHVNTGKYATYIPYEERDSYQSTLVQQQFQMNPLVVPWKMRIRVYIRGIYYLYQTQASIAGLADGFMLAENHTNDTPCLLSLDSWETYVDKNKSVGVEGGVGYVAMTFNTWGLRNSLWSQYDKNIPLPPYRVEGVAKDELRLNLRFLLRDRYTVMNYHFDVGDMVDVYQNEYVLRIDLLDGFDGQPVLPYVDAFNGMGFDGIVVPWEETITKQVTF